MKKGTVIVLILATAMLLSSCHNHKKGKNSLTLFHAGSLSIPFKEIIKEYNKDNPEVKIFAESSGSLDAARKITDLGKECDILAVADFQVIDKLVIPEFADWNYVFASNSMVIAYTRNSRYSTSFSSDNWYEIIAKEDVYIGRSDPNADPCGYRSVFVFKLAENFYKTDGIEKILLEKTNTVIRPKEVDLLALLETGNIDYLMIYKSVAIQHNYDYIELPEEVNLSNPEFEDLYNSVSLEVTGSEPGKTALITGSSILYSFTIPKNAPNTELAIDFVQFLTNPEKGGKILEEKGMGVVNFCDSKYLDKLPEQLIEVIN